MTYDPTYHKEYRKKNQEYLLKKRNEYKESNRNLLNAKQKEYYHNNKERMRAKARERYYKAKNSSPELFLWRAAKHRAKSKGLEFSISIDDISIPEYCPVFPWIKLECCNKVSKQSPSLDRRDNAKGYTPGNIRVISHHANSLKKNLDTREFQRIYKYILGEI